MRAWIVLVLLAGVAHAGDFFEPPSPMTRLEALPKRAKSLVETRAIQGLGQAWRYANGDEPDLVVIAADGAWWIAPPVVLSGGEPHMRLALRVIGGRVALAITVETRSHVAATMVCMRNPQLVCEFVPS